MAMLRIFAAIFLAAWFTYILRGQQNPQATESSVSSRKVSCDQANTQIEMNECAAQQYQKADAQLNALYSSIMQHFQRRIIETERQKDSGQKAHEQIGLTNLRQAVRAWIQYRSAHCAAARQRYEGGSISPMIYSNCMAELTDHRVEELKNAYGLEEDK